MTLGDCLAGVAWGLQASACLAQLVWDKAMRRRRELRRGRLTWSTGDGAGGPAVAAAAYGVSKR